EGVGSVRGGGGAGGGGTIPLWRDGREQQLRAKLEELANQTTSRPAGAPGAGSSEEERFGWKVTPMTPELAARLGLGAGARGVVITDVDPAGAAAEAGLQAGGAIEQGHRQAVRPVGELESAPSRAHSPPPPP